MKIIWNQKNILTYLLTPWSRVLLEKLASLQLVKKFPAFYGTQRFLTAFTSARHLSLSWASPIQSSYPNPTSWRSILLSSHLRLGLPSGLFPSVFPTSTLYTPLPSPIRATYYVHKMWSSEGLKEVANIVTTVFQRSYSYNKFIMFVCVFILLCHPAH